MSQKRDIDPTNEDLSANATRHGAPVPREFEMREMVLSEKPKSGPFYALPKTSRTPLVEFDRRSLQFPWRLPLPSFVRSFLSLAFVVSASILAFAQAGAVFHFTEPRGPEEVGLKVVEQYDFTRMYRGATDELGKPFTGERARPLQTLIWYPAERSSGSPMTIGDYLRLRTTETVFDKTSAGAAPDPQDAELGPVLGERMVAVRDAPVKAGRYPVVIYAPSFSSESWENADLCEYLASSGYVVVASPDMGVSTRDMTADVPGIDAQARDISFLVGYAQTLPDTDMTEVAVGGYSWGGISNLFAASRDSRIRALFALDGSMRYFPALVKQADVHPEQLTIPLLYFTQGEISLEDQARDADDKTAEGPNVLNEWTHGDLIKVDMMGMTHGEFSSLTQRSERFWKKFPAAQKADYGREDGMVSFGWVARYTREFLDAYLRHDAAALDFLKKAPRENGVPPHLIAANFRAGSGTVVSLDGFREELNRQGFDHAAEIYSALQKQDPNFKLTEGFLNEWGYHLMTGNHVPEAIGIFKLNVVLYPNSSNVYDSLAEEYMKAGQKQLAIEFYMKSLEKNPANDNAKQKLKELESAAPAAQ
jgi:dienelactone hydrolase